MRTKIIEVRDKATFMPMLAVEINVGFLHPHEAYLLRRLGYAMGERYIFLTCLSGGVGRGTSDPYEWNDRTRQTAHHWIIKNWDALKPGEVVDVEFILGERTSPKVSEREEARISRLYQETSS